MCIHNWKRHLILTTWVLATLLLTGSCNNPLPSSPPQSDSAEEPGSPVVNPNPPAPRGGGESGGIPNIGNSCYMNAVLQIFKTLYPDVFKEALNNNQATLVAQAGKAIMDQIKDDKAPATQEAAQAFRAAIESEEGLGWKVGSGQQDAEELLTKLFAILNPSKIAMPSLLTKKSNGQSRLTDTSNSCSMLLIHLEASSPAMQDLLDTRFQEEDVQCDFDGTGANVPCKKKMQLGDLSQLPKNILPIHVERSATKGGHTGVPYASSKVEDPIQDPCSITIRKEHQTNGTQDKPYTLVAFIQHTGSSIDGGHYVAYAQRGGQWVRYDDASVSAVTPEEAGKAAEQAYVYFYQPS